MAKTILEDISIFLGKEQTNNLILKNKYDIAINKMNESFIQYHNLIKFNKINLDKEYEFIKKEFNILKNDVGGSIDDILKLLDKIKIFIGNNNAQNIYNNKLMNTKYIKLYNFIVKELVGAAEDRVDIRTELSYEIDKRRSQDNTLNTKIESEISNRIDSMNKIKNELKLDISSIDTKVTNIQSNISAETNSRINSISQLQNLIQTETDNRNTSLQNVTNVINTLNNKIDTEQVVRTSEDNKLNDKITSTKSELINMITESETRRISDYAIFTARDNLEETESKSRDLQILTELRNNVYSNAPLKTSNITWDSLADNPADINSIDTSIGADKHGLLANTIRKLRVVSNTLFGNNEPVATNGKFTMSSGGNADIGLDYWKGSSFTTNGRILYYDNEAFIESNTNKNVIYLGRGTYKEANLLDGTVRVRATDKRIDISDITHLYMTGATDIDFGTSSTVKAKIFEGTAIKSLYADLAERYKADAIYEPGTVLAIGGKYEVTKYKYGMPLAGVVSTNPAFRLNDNINLDEEYQNYNPFIALKGRIPVKVNNSVKKGMYVLADDNGRARGYTKLPTDYQLRMIGIALNDSIYEYVEVKI